MDNSSLKRPLVIMAAVFAAAIMPPLAVGASSSPPITKSKDVKALRTVRTPECVAPEYGPAPPCPLPGPIVLARLRTKADSTEAATIDAVMHLKEPGPEGTEARVRLTLSINGEAAGRSAPKLVEAGSPTKIELRAMTRLDPGSNLIVLRVEPPSLSGVVTIGPGKLAVSGHV